MASHQALFTASRWQTLTYLLGVCPFSIAFLVFINATVSFVVTDLIGLHDGEGDAVGTLGFADELLALAACPLWGLLSDRIGVRYVSVYLVRFRATYTFSWETAPGLHRRLRHCSFGPRSVRSGKECLSSAPPGKAAFQPRRSRDFDDGDSCLAGGNSEGRGVGRAPRSTSRR